jgi:hypothetical protein
VTPNTNGIMCDLSVFDGGMKEILLGDTFMKG